MAVAGPPTGAHAAGGAEPAQGGGDRRQLVIVTSERRRRNTDNAAIPGASAQHQRRSHLMGPQPTGRVPRYLAKGRAASAGRPAHRDAVSDACLWLSRHIVVSDTWRAIMA